MFRTFLIAVLGFVAGAVITYVPVVAGALWVWQLTGVHDQDGGGAMTLGLVIGPFFGALGGIAGTFLALVLDKRRRRNAPPQGDAERHRDTRRFFILGAVIAGGFAGHYAAQIGFWFASPIQIDSLWKVRAITWLPTLATGLGALAGGLWMRRWVERSGK
jgi:hypothetical protein